MVHSWAAQPVSPRQHLGCNLVELPSVLPQAPSRKALKAQEKRAEWEAAKQRGLAAEEEEEEEEGEARRARRRSRRES